MKISDSFSKIFCLDLLLCVQNGELLYNKTPRLDEGGEDSYVKENDDSP